jgi:hypothetical protein
MEVLSMRKRFLIPILGLLMVCGYAGYVVAFGDLQETQGRLPVGAPDLTTASVVEVRNDSGAVVLRGEFGEATVSGNETERHAELKAAGPVASAKGTAEIEIVRSSNRTERELELDVEGLPAGATYSILLDNQSVGNFRSDPRGTAEVELKDEQ